MGRTKNVTVIPVFRLSRQEMLSADHKRAPIHMTKKRFSVCTVYRVAALNPWHFTMPSMGHMAAHMLSLPTPLYQP